MKKRLLKAGFANRPEPSNNAVRSFLRTSARYLDSDEHVNDGPIERQRWIAAQSLPHAGSGYFEQRVHAMRMESVL